MYICTLHNQVHVVNMHDVCHAHAWRVSRICVTCVTQQVCHTMDRLSQSTAQVTSYLVPYTFWIGHLNNGVTTWTMVSLHEQLCHDLNNGVTTWTIVSRPEQLCLDLNNCVTTWTIVSRPEQWCHDLNNGVTTWTIVSRPEQWCHDRSKLLI